jgi:uncharacterized protein
MRRFFQSRGREIEDQIEAYLCCVSRACLIFSEGVRDYFRDNRGRLEERRQEISQVEREADDLLKKIKHVLCAYMLIPESRGDVLELLDDLDDIVDTTKQVLLQLSIETPAIPGLLKDDFLDMTQASLHSVDELVRGVRAFFLETRMVPDYVNKVYFYEKEADRLEELMKRKVFSSDEITRLSCKMHIRHFIEKIALLSDKSEEIAKNLLIYAAKRTI